MNDSNLTPFNELSEERKREIQEMGRQANAKKWAEVKTLNKIFHGIGTTKTPKKLKEQLENLGFDTKNMGLVEAFCNIWATKIMTGKVSPKDIKDFIDTYARYTGQEPVQKIEIEDKPVINIDVPR